MRLDRSFARECFAKIGPTRLMKTISIKVRATDVSNRPGNISIFINERVRARGEKEWAHMSIVPCGYSCVPYICSCLFCSVESSFQFPFRFIPNGRGSLFGRIQTERNWRDYILRLYARSPLYTFSVHTLYTHCILYGIELVITKRISNRVRKVEAKVEAEVADDCYAPIKFGNIHWKNCRNIGTLKMRGKFENWE